MDHEANVMRARPGPAAAERPRSNAGALIDALAGLGYRTAFGIPGGAIASVFAALSGHAGIRTVLSQHEGGAAYMAMGQSLVSGGREVGLCFATSGPGITNLITGVAAAFEEQVPIFVLTGNVSTALIGKGAAQDAYPGGTDAVGMLRPVTARSVSAMKATDIVPLAIELHREALASRRPVHLNVPVNLASEPSAEITGARLRPGASALEAPHQPSAPPPDDHDAIEDGIRALLSAERPLILAGHGVKTSGLGAALADAIARIGLPTLVTSHAKGALSEDHPLFLGTFGFAAPPASTGFLQAYAPDVLVFLGTDLGETSTAGWSPLLARPPIKIHVDHDERSFNRNYRVQIAVRAQIGTFLARLVARWQTRGPDADPRRAQRLWAVCSSRPPRIEAPASFATSGPMHPAALMEDLHTQLPDDALIFADIGNTMAWAIHHLAIRGRQEFYVPMGLGAMGSGLCAAIGAKAARPERPVVALVGDCAMMMHGTELLTASLAGVGVKVLVLNDGGHGMVEHGLQLLGMPADGLRFPRRVDFAAFGRALGVPAIHVRDLNQLRQLDWSRHLRSRQPLIVDLAIDPSAVPPILARTRVLGIGGGPSAGVEPAAPHHPRPGGEP
jgi:acetolactate synthase-1/2/3 large subunit